MITEEERAELAKINAPGTPLREFQLFQLGILKEFIRVCEENGLAWYGAAGTLLGAARHSGFIPWDDDIDVWMPVEDYFAFRELVTEHDVLGPEFYFQCHSENPANFIFWQRIGVKQSTSLPKEYADIPAEWGVCIDIFPLGSVADPADEVGYGAYEQALKNWKQVSKKYLYAHDAKSLSGIKKAYHLFRAAGSDAANIKRWEACEEFVIVKGAGHANPELLRDPDDPSVFRREWFGEPVLLPFEDMELKVPHDYKSVLATMYGQNWDSLPPKEVQVCHSGGGSDEVIVSLTEPWEKFL